ncbi:MAG: dihydroorotate dehydrogenase electron transfer subunit [Deltaproteobacteria bacterium]|nr:dihydroorotate dehydrogenase electron transfer subunit [Deltaproteobacteria bacterium]
MERPSRILYNETVLPGYFRMGISWKTPEIIPGHFVMLKVSDGLDPFLRRPLGVYNVLGGKGAGAFRGGGIELLYKVVGKGTKILSLKRPGESVGVLGPLGNGFPTACRPSRKAIIIGGGMGVVPLYLLAKRLKNVAMLFGVRTKKEAALVKDFKGLEIKLLLSSEDGSIGHKGLVTDLLRREITPASVIYACGPLGMLKSVSVIAGGVRARCYVSLERSMACGIGVCLGCAVKASAHKEKADKEYRMVCSDGPVFNAEDIDWGSL